MHLRKKLHDAIVDGDEDDCPKRKIKKLDFKFYHTLKVFTNQHILSKIIKYVIAGNDKTMLDFLHLRLVSKSFDDAVLSQIRAEYRQVQVSPSEESEFGESIVDENQEKSFFLNDRRIWLNKAPQFFSFLHNVARIRTRDLLFAGFSHPDEQIHNCVLEQFVAHNWMCMNSFKGSEEVCYGCEMCCAIAARAKVYGPLQVPVLFNGNLGAKHFEQLIVTELLLADIADYCVLQIGSKAEAFTRLDSLISPRISCDQLDLVFSDRVMWSNQTLSHPREVIDTIVRTWRVQSVNVRFMTGYSSERHDVVWKSKGVFTEMRFDEHFVAEHKHFHHRDPRRLTRVEVDMLEGDEIATCFAQSMGLFERGGLSATSFQNVCANVKRVFPTQEIFLVLPTELARVAAAEFDEFCEALLEFAWKDERTARHSRLYFRLYTFGITEKEVLRQVEKQFKIHCRPVAAMLSSAAVRGSFLKWLPGTTSAFDRSLLSFTDSSNNCVLHLEVCIEPA